MVWASAAEAAETGCKSKKPEVFIQGKTPVRRGPGLNYPVLGFLEKGGCASFSEASLDKQWVLVESGGRLGWVPTARLSAQSQEWVAELKMGAAPVGSGQERGYGLIERQTILREGPKSSTAPRRALPEGLQVLPLSMSVDGKWVQVRDERGELGWVVLDDIRGDSIASLPRSDEGYQGDPSEASLEQGQVVAPAPPAETPIGITASIFVAALAPIHRLSSNGIAATRRYDLAALAPGTGLELQVTDLGPVSARLSYVLGFLAGVQPEGAAIDTGGMQHDVSIRLGMPLASGDLLITPELGYHASWFDYDLGYAGGPGIVFVSSHAHGGILGARLQYLLSQALMFEADAGGLVGLTLEQPLGLGDGGFTFGAQGSAGVQYLFTDGIGMTLRYVFYFRSVSFTGQALLDPSITDATLSAINQGALVGVTFALGR